MTPISTLRASADIWSNVEVLRIVGPIAIGSGLSIEDIAGGSRESRIARARHESMYKLRLNTSYTYKQIGAFFNRRTPATVYYAFVKIAKIKEGKR